MSEKETMDKIKARLLIQHQEHMKMFGTGLDHSDILRNVPVERMTVSEFMRGSK